VKRFRGGLVFEAHRLVYHSTLGLRVIKRRRRKRACSEQTGPARYKCLYHSRKVDVRLPANGNSNSHGARPVHLIITMIKWIRTSRLSIKNSLSAPRQPAGSALSLESGFDDDGELARLRAENLVNPETRNISLILRLKDLIGPVTRVKKKKKKKKPKIRIQQKADT